MEPVVYQKFREALRMLSFRRHGMAREALEELASATQDPECLYWLAYVYRRMRLYDKSLEILHGLEDCSDEVVKLRAEQRSYELFRQAMELQGRGEYHKILDLLEQARESVADDPDLAHWIDEELDFYRAATFEP